MSKIETTQSSFLLRYGATLIIFIEVFMICTVMVLYATNGAYIPTFIMLFLAPLLGNIITGKIAKKTKKVLFKETFDKYFVIMNIILYILIYFFNFKFNIIMVVIYGLGATIGFLNTKKTIKKFKENIEVSETDGELFNKGEKIKIKQFNLGNLNGENIREFLKLNNLKEENYLLAQIIPTAKEYLLYGAFSVSTYLQYVLYFDDEKLYFFELSKLTNKAIKNGFFAKFEDLKIIKLRKGLISYKVKIEFKDGSIVNMQIAKKVARLFLQKKYSEKLFTKFSELKNKENQEQEKIKNKEK